jgi:hypothetical protein
MPTEPSAGTGGVSVGLAMRNPTLTPSTVNDHVEVTKFEHVAVEWPVRATGPDLFFCHS